MTAILDAASAVVGDRTRIHRDEMTAILLGLWPLENEGCDADPAGWAASCTGINVVSIVEYSGGVTAIRYDSPGSMHPTMRAALMFVPEGAVERSLDYLSERAARLLIVGDGVPAADGK